MHQPKPEKLPESLAERYALVQSRIAQAARRAGKRADAITLVAVTKYAEPEQIRELINLGHRDFGENRAQVLVQHAAIADEHMARARMLSGAQRSALLAHVQQTGVSPARGAGATPASNGGVRWHMIGHLQRNKARKIVEHCRLVHSLDSLRLAEELQAIGMKQDRVIEVLLQVNCSGEENKYGCPFPAAIRLAEQVAEMVHLRLRGLMTMAAYSDNPEDARPAFIRCRELFEEMQKLRLNDGKAPFNILSMGMSGDFEVAIEEGANIVRVGTSIFGESASERPPELPEED